MPTEHRVKQGECISSIADKYGFFPEAICNDPANAQLKEKRKKNKNILHPGDIVIIPDKRMKEESGGTEQRHRFRKKGVPSKCRLRILTNGEPRKNVPYILQIEGEIFSGTTDADGRLEHSIPPNARKGRLLVGEKIREEYLLKLGELDPVEEITGVQARLRNLGFDCGSVNGVLNPQTKTALKEFQRNSGLSDSGDLDEARVLNLRNYMGDRKKWERTILALRARS